MKAKLGGTLYRDMGDKAKVIRIVRVFDDRGNYVRFLAIGVDIDKANKHQPPHKAAKGREREIEEKVKSALKKRGYEVVE